MISLISENQPLFALGFVVFLVVTVLLILQYAVIRYGQQLFTQAIRCWVRIKRNLAKNKRIILFRGKYPKLDVIMSRFYFELAIVKTLDRTSV